MNKNPLIINIQKDVGAFAENKDKARNIRLEQIVPALKKDQEVILDFTGVEGATQSFIHALISELIRQDGGDVLDQIAFKNCNEAVQKTISIVVEYMQQSE